MAAKRYFGLVAGRVKAIVATIVSAGVANEGDLVALDAAGKLDNSVLPAGVGGEVKVVIASEALADGDFVNVYNNAGTANVRKADASDPAKFANGFVLANVANAGNASVYCEGINNHCSGLTVGLVWLSATVPGTATAAVPATTGHIVQQIGVALSATEVTFEPQMTIEIG